MKVKENEWFLIIWYDYIIYHMDPDYPSYCLPGACQDGLVRDALCPSLLHFFWWTNRNSTKAVSFCKTQHDALSTQQFTDFLSFPSEICEKYIFLVLSREVSSWLGPELPIHISIASDLTCELKPPFQKEKAALTRRGERVIAQRDHIPSIPCCSVQFYTYCMLYWSQRHMVTIRHILCLLIKVGS